MGVMLEPTNYLADTRPDDIKFLDKIAKKIKGKEETTNSSVPIVLPYFNFLTIQRGVAYGFGNFDFPAFVINGSLFCNAVGRDIIRMSELPELNLSLVFNLARVSALGPVSHSTYTVPIYFNMYIYNSIEPNPSGSINKKIISLSLGNMTWDNMTAFTWVNPSQTLNLKNYISDRRRIDGLYDFTSNNTQITRSQYLELVNSKSTLLNATLTYDPSQMTNSEQNHFNNAFHNLARDEQSHGASFTVFTTAVFTYIGSLASFKPTIIN